MRVLFMATPTPSHFTPMIPLVWALRTAGHDVLVAGQPDIVGPALAAGLPAAEIGDLYDAVEAIRAKLPEGLRPNQAGRAQVTDATPFTLVMPWLMHARYMMKEYLEFAREWRPDLVISDPMEFSALLIGGLLGVPVPPDVHGLDLSGLAAGAAGAKGREVVFSEYPENEEAMARSSRYKLIVGSGRRARRDGYETGAPPTGPYERLYDERDDPDERRDLAADPRLAGVKDELLGSLARRFVATWNGPEPIPPGLSRAELIRWCLIPRDKPNPGPPGHM